MRCRSAVEAVAGTDDGYWIDEQTANGRMTKTWHAYSDGKREPVVVSEPDETVDAVVERLLAVAAVDDAQWGAW